MRILIADDEKEFVEMLEDWLRNKKIRWDIAYDGNEAVDLLKANKYDLAIIDHNIPGITGLELIEYIKGNHLKCKTVMVTGYEEMDEVIARAAGADEYLVKPIGIEDIESILEKYRPKGGRR